MIEKLKKARDKNKVCVAVLIDLSKAFEHYRSDFSHYADDTTPYNCRGTHFWRQYLTLKQQQSTSLIDFAIIMLK